MASPTTKIEQLMAINEAIVRADRQGFRRAVEEVMHPDAEWRPLITAVEGGAYRGHEGVMAFYDDLVGSFDVSYADVDFRTVEDDLVLLLEQMRLRGHGSEIRVVYDIGVIYEFDGDLVRRAQVYDSHPGAIAAAEALRA